MSKVYDWMNVCNMISIHKSLICEQNDLWCENITGYVNLKFFTYFYLEMIKRKC